MSQGGEICAQCPPSTFFSDFLCALEGWLLAAVWFGLLCPLTSVWVQMTGDLTCDWRGKRRRWSVYPPYMCVWKRPSLGRLRLWSGSVSPSPYLSWALLSSLWQIPLVASLGVLHHPLVGFLNLFTLLLIVPAITPLNEPSVSCQDPSQVNLGEMLENLQCLLAS